MKKEMAKVVTRAIGRMGELSRTSSRFGGAETVSALFAPSFGAGADAE